MSNYPIKMKLVFEPFGKWEEIIFTSISKDGLYINGKARGKGIRRKIEGAEYGQKITKIVMDPDNFSISKTDFSDMIEKLKRIFKGKGIEIVIEKKKKMPRISKVKSR